MYKLLRFPTVQFVLGEDILIGDHKVSQTLFPFIGHFTAFKVDICQSTVLKPLKGGRGGI